MSSTRPLVAKIPKWAELEPPSEKKSQERNESDDEEDSALAALQEMTRSTGKYITKPKVLSKLHLATNHLKDITVGHNSNGSIRCVKFHPERPVLVTGSQNGTISLFELCDEESNLQLKKDEHFLQDVSFKDFSIASLDLFNSGTSIFAHSGYKNYCYSYDLVEGKVSQIFVPKAFRDLRVSKVVLSADGIFSAHLLGVTDLFIFVLNTMEHLHTFRAHEKLVDFAFSPYDRNIIYALAENGGVYCWNMLSQGEQSHFMDDGCVRATCLATSPNGQFIACGSNTGVVNVYEAASAFSSSDTGTLLSNSCRPLYTLNNLTTSALFLKFNHDAQLMSFGSNVKFMAGRMLHCQSGNTFQNFPSRPEMLAKERLKCCDFSPNSAFFVFGTESGDCRLYRLNYFEKY